MKRLVVSTTLAFALVAPSAFATPNFPSAIAQHLGLRQAPDCSLCHDGTPSSGTATTPFALSMRQRGLVANDVGSLTNALEALRGEQTDSDCDGVPDIDELLRGSDPNVATATDGGAAPGGACGNAVKATYGCSIGRIAGRNAEPASVLVMLLVAAALRSRGRRRNAPRAPARRR
jgi:hypothetical protein